MKTMFKKDGEHFVRMDESAQLLGISYSQLSRFSQDYEQLIDKEKDPGDGRKSGYSLASIVKLLVRLDSGFEPSSIFEDRNFMKGDEQVLTEIEDVLSDFEYDQVTRIVMGKTPTTSEEGDGIPVVGVDVINVREGVATLVGDVDLEQMGMTQSEFNHQKEYVEDQCWGFYDELNEECNKHCRISMACAASRNSILSHLAEEAEKRDAKNMKYHDMESKMENIKKMRDKVLGDEDLESWASD